MLKKVSTAIGMLLLSGSFAFAGQAPASTTAPNAKPATSNSASTVKRKVRKARKAKKHKKHRKASTTAGTSTTTKK